MGGRRAGFAVVLLWGFLINTGIFQKPRLIAEYGMRATSVKPGSGSPAFNTASTLQFLTERVFL
jgi:hypothetical protein